MPAASRAMVLAVAGAMITSSARSATWMCPISDSWVRSKRSKNTGRPVSAWNVSSPMKWRALAVMTTCTWAPAFTSKRTSSAAL